MSRDATSPPKDSLGAQRQRAAAFAPASIGNVGPGLDVLGMALTGSGDRVVAQREGSSGVTIDDAGHPEVPAEAIRNTAGIAAFEVLRRAGADVGVRITISKGLPLAGGQGGSSASAVAAAVATNRLVGAPLDANALLACALEAEAAVSGRHADNLAAQLLGGIVLVRSIDPLDVIRLPAPEELRIVLAYPDQRMPTIEAREVLPKFVARATVVQQMANVAAMVAALHADDLGLLGRALDDQIAEPARAPLLPGFVEAKAAAKEAGSIGGSISGAGPTSFWLAGDDITARRVADAVKACYEAMRITCLVRVARVAPRGALELPDDATSA